MKTKFLIFFTALLSFAGIRAQNVTFADAKFKESLLGASATNPNNYVSCYDQNGDNILADQNHDGEIQLSEAALIYRIDLRQSSSFTSLEGINYFINLKNLGYFNDSGYSHIHPKIGDINIDGLQNLKIFNLSDCDIEKISIKNCPNLSEVKSIFTDTYNASSFDLHGSTQDLIIDNCPLLETVIWTNNNLKVANITNCSNILKLELRGNSMTNFNASPLINLEYLDISNNQQTIGGYSSGEANFDPSLANINITGLSKLTYLNVANQLLSSIDMVQVPSLRTLICENNKITELNVQAAPNLSYLDASKNHITNQGIDWQKMNIYQLYLDLSSNALSSEIIVNSPIDDFNYINLSNNSITKFIVNSNFNCNYYSDSLHSLVLRNNLIQEIRFTVPNFIYNMIISNNPITTFDNPSLTVNYLVSENTGLSNIMLKGIGGLYYINNSSESLKIIADHITAFMDEPIDIIENKNLKEVDFSKMKSINSDFSMRRIIDNPTLKFINFKNGTSDRYNFVGWSQLDNNPNLKYICCDDFEIPQFQNILTSVGLQDQCSLNSYCSFVPGGEYNTITGKVRFDGDGNGCDINDAFFEKMKININDGTNSGNTFVEKDGTYKFYTQSGNFTVTPLPENPSLFNLYPSSFITSFADNNNNTFTQDICVSANGNQKDVEVVFTPLTNARPGFEAKYQLVYKNKGNQLLAGTATLNFDSSKMSFVSSDFPVNVNGSQASFSYSNLKPYESKTVNFVFNINAPTNPTNPVNIGDILNFAANIAPVNDDVNPDDNSFNFNQMVVGSYDPNDIVCLEGNRIAASEAGKYLHYIVNFENTGNAEAENIVAEMDINPDDFDIKTLQLINASHSVYTKITRNKVEFIMKQIKLQSGDHGNISLKIKTLSSKTSGDRVSNKANIYFDYNFPVETNTAITNFEQTLMTNELTDSSIKIYPIPTKGNITIEAAGKIFSVEVYDALGRMVMKHIDNSNMLNVDLHSISTGNYFLKINTENGAMVKKMLKE